VRRALAAAGAVVVGLAPARAMGDGAYGRLDGDVELRASAGVAFGEGAPSFTAGVGAVYLQTAGVYGLYTDAFDEGAALRRSIATGVHVQPLFLARYANDLERGPAHVDLLIDSLAFQVGPFWGAPRAGSLRSEPGLELAALIAVPVLPRANGPFLEVRGALRWRPGELSGSRESHVLERGALLTLTLAYHHTVSGNIVDARDRRSR
jgi:hypothetical protein